MKESKRDEKKEDLCEQAVEEARRLLRQVNYTGQADDAEGRLDLPAAYEILAVESGHSGGWVEELIELFEAECGDAPPSDWDPDLFDQVLAFGHGLQKAGYNLPLWIERLIDDVINDRVKRPTRRGRKPHQYQTRDAQLAFVARAIHERYRFPLYHASDTGTDTAVDIVVNATAREFEDYREFSLARQHERRWAQQSAPPADGHKPCSPSTEVAQVRPVTRDIVMKALRKSEKNRPDDQ